jgi:hypothetical protein
LEWEYVYLFERLTEQSTGAGRQEVPRLFWKIKVADGKKWSQMVKNIASLVPAGKNGVSLEAPMTKNLPPG